MFLNRKFAPAIGIIAITAPGWSRIWAYSSPPSWPFWCYSSEHIYIPPIPPPIRPTLLLLLFFFFPDIDLFTFFISLLYTRSRSLYNSPKIMRSTTWHQRQIVKEVELLYSLTYESMHSLGLPRYAFLFTLRSMYLCVYFDPSTCGLQLICTVRLYTYDVRIPFAFMRYNI